MVLLCRSDVMRNFRYLYAVQKESLCETDEEWASRRCSLSFSLSLKIIFQYT